MTTDPHFQVAKYASHIPVSETVHLGHLLAGPIHLAHRVTEGVDRVMNATPEQRAQWRREAAEREAADLQARAQLRDSVEAVPLTLDTLAAKFEAGEGWDRAYLEHLVQPYCDCASDREGWEYCQHAQDLGLAP